MNRLLTRESYRRDLSADYLRGCRGSVRELGKERQWGAELQSVTVLVELSRHKLHTHASVVGESGLGKLLSQQCENPANITLALLPLLHN